MLQRGYAVASATLNTFGNNCAELLAAETMMMVKEHFIEAYGAPQFTIGWGGSGGSYQQHHIADDYPGPSRRNHAGTQFSGRRRSAPCPSSRDARLLKNYFDTLATLPFTRRAEAADHGLRQSRDRWPRSTMVQAAFIATEHCPPALAKRSATTR